MTTIGSNKQYKIQHNNNKRHSNNNGKIVIVKEKSHRENHHRDKLYKDKKVYQNSKDIMDKETEHSQNPICNEDFRRTLKCKETLGFQKRISEKRE